MGNSAKGFFHISQSTRIQIFWGLTELTPRQRNTYKRAKTPGNEPELYLKGHGKKL